MSRFGVLESCYATMAWIVLCGNALAVPEFEIMARSGDTHMFIDETHTFSFSVRMTDQDAGTTTLSNAMPHVTAPDCALQYGILSLTYQGDGPVLNWQEGQTKVLEFSVHVFDNPSGVSICNDICQSQGLVLNMTVSAEDLAPVSVDDPQDLLSLPQPQGNLLVLEERISSTGAVGSFPYGEHAQRVITPDVTGPVTVGPGELVVWMINWNPNSTDLENTFYYMNYSLQNDFACFFRGQYVLNDATSYLIDDVDGVLDNTGTLPTSPIITSPVGGADGVYLFDVTTYGTTCTGAVRDNISYASAGTAHIGFSSYQVPSPQVWGMALYRASQSACNAAALVFGPPPSGFEVQSFHLSPTGHVSGSVSLPSSPVNWNTSNYAVQWFLKGDSFFMPLTNQSSVKTELEADVVLPEVLDDLQLEARVTHLGSGSVSATSSAAHGVDYGFIEATSWLGSEAPPDEFLDPGETAESFVLGIHNVLDSDMNNGLLTLSYEADMGQVEMVIESSQVPTTIAAGTTYNAVFNLSFLLSDEPCVPVNVFWKLQFQRDGVDMSYGGSFQKVVNCQNERITFSSFGQWSGTDNWTQSGQPSRSQSQWVFQDQDSDLQLLTSPASHADAQVGDGPFHFRIVHQPGLLLNLAGGRVEYRVASPGQPFPSTWNDLILELEDMSGDTYYNALPFPTSSPPGVTNHLAGKRVFMDWEPPAESQVIDVDSDDAWQAFAGKNIQFRFVTQSPYYGFQEAVDQSWTIQEFQFTSTQRRLDNVLGVPNLEDLSFFYCHDVIIPLGAQDAYYGYWYTSIADLKNDQPTNQGPIVGSEAVWDDFVAPADDERWFLRVSNSLGTERIIPFNLVVPDESVPPRPQMLPHWSITPALVDYDLVPPENPDQSVDIRDLVYRETEDVCSQPQ